MFTRLLTPSQNKVEAAKVLFVSVVRPLFGSWLDSVLGNGRATEPTASSQASSYSLAQRPHTGPMQGMLRLRIAHKPSLPWLQGSRSAAQSRATLCPAHGSTQHVRIRSQHRDRGSNQFESFLCWGRSLNSRTARSRDLQGTLLELKQNLTKLQQR